jgi:nitroreductase
MAFFEVLKARHSIRAYADTPVEDDTLDQILEAVNLAPSAGNLQAGGGV